MTNQLRLEYTETKNSPTEQRNENTKNISSLDSLSVVKLINSEDDIVNKAVKNVISEIGDLVSAASLSIKSGGKIHYIGAGTSGRIGVLDAVELAPTYGVGEEWFVAHLAGGSKAMFKAVEGAEDDYNQGAKDLGEISSNDIVIGLAASGTTPYVAGAINYANSIGAKTSIITSNPSSPIANVVNYPIILNTGPEVIAGSTRMKAATAQKLVVNTFSTAVMVLVGKTYSNLMVDVRPSNKKLQERVKFLLMQATGCNYQIAETILSNAGGDLKVAIVALLHPKYVKEIPNISQESLSEIISALKQSSGRVDSVLSSI